MGFVHLKQYMNVARVAGLRTITFRFNSTAHDSLWHRSKLEEGDDLKEARALSYSSKTSLHRSPRLQGTDDVYNRLKLIQQRRSIQAGGGASFKQVEKGGGSSSQMTERSAAQTSGGNTGQEGDKKPPPKELLIGVFIAFVAGGVIVRLLIGEDKDEGDKSPTLGSGDKARSLRVPASSNQIPDEVPYLLVGGGTASFSAFRAIKTRDPTAKILVVSQEPHYPYMRPPLSKEMFYGEDRSRVGELKFRQWNGTVRSIFYEPDEFYVPCEELSQSENGGISVARGWGVSALDPTHKVVYLDDGKPVKYGKCLLATGSRPRVEAPFDKVLGDARLAERFNFYRGIRDFRKLEEAVERGAKKIVIVGNGFLGSELACALARRGGGKLDVVQLFREGEVLSKVLPGYLRRWATDRVKREGVEIRGGAEVVRVNNSGGKVELELAGGDRLGADVVVVAVGAEPQADLGGLETDPRLGGYVVNTELAARTDLYAAGDCACFYDSDLAARRRVEHHDHAVISGRLAGENMTGAAKPYLHQPMFWSDLGADTGFEAIGIVDSELPTVGVFAKGDGGAVKEEAVPGSTPDTPNPEKQEDYNKGVIFYLRDEVVVGIVLWNLFNKMDIARLVLREKKRFPDLNQVAKLFNIHSIKETSAGTEAVAAAASA